MGIVTLLLTTFLGVFGPAQNNIQRAIGAQDISRMKDALSTEMSIYRSSEQMNYDNSFDKAFEMLKGSSDPNMAILVYQYKALLQDTDDDGILPPYTGDNGVQGRDFIIQTAVRRLDVDSSKIEEEIAPSSIEGAVYVVAMTQLVEDNGSLNLGAAAEIVNPDGGGEAENSTDYLSAVLTFKADFYRLRVNKFEYVAGGAWDFSNIGGVLTSINMAVRR